MTTLETYSTAIRELGIFDEADYRLLVHALAATDPDLFLRLGVELGLIKSTVNRTLTDAAIKRAFDQFGRTAALKECRSLMGVSLKEAINYVDDICGGKS